MTAPEQTLDHAGIVRLVPHRNAMCLLDRLLAWTPTSITCAATNHRDAEHPLRSASGLLASATIEYAAQAMALHGALLGLEAGRPPSPGLLVSARGVVLERLRLDDLSGDALMVEATRLVGDERQLLYAFTVHNGPQRIASGRVAVVLDTVPASA